MRILHTSDWHLGRTFHRVGLLDAQAGFVDHLVDVVRSERVDVVLVAGDVYDRAIPGVDVVSLLDEALARLVGAGARVVLSSGNHDSARRLGFGARLMAAGGVHVFADAESVGRPLLLDDEHGPVAFYPLPYLEPSLAAEALGCSPTHDGVLSAAMGRVRDDLATRPAGTRSVVAAHAFVVGATGCDSERDIAVGGVGAVSASVFDGIDYLALGHLHGRQTLRETVRYSGSPLAYSFSEYQHVKGSWLVELDASGAASVEPVAAPVPRPLALLRGTLDELLTRPDLAVHEQSWCQVTLTDDERPVDAMRQVQQRFAHALELRFEPAGGLHVPVLLPVQGRSDLDICCDFVQHVRRRSVQDAERDLLHEAMVDLRLLQAEEAGAAVLRDRARSRRGVVTSPAAVVTATFDEPLFDDSALADVAAAGAQRPPTPAAGRTRPTTEPQPEIVTGFLWDDVG